MPNLYKERHERQQAEINAFPMFWAYSEKQYMEGMKKLGVENESELCYLGAGLGGGIIRKADKQNYLDMLSRHRHERADAIAEDKTGNGFIYDMFDYELANHEYVITMNSDDAIGALGLTWDDIKADPRLALGLRKAKKHQIDTYNEDY